MYHRTIQRTKLQQFDPRGNQQFSELRALYVV